MKAALSKTKWYILQTTHGAIKSLFKVFLKHVWIFRVTVKSPHSGYLHIVDNSRSDGAIFVVIEPLHSKPFRILDTFA